MEKEEEEKTTSQNSIKYSIKIAVSSIDSEQT